MAWTQVNRRDERKTWGGPIHTDADGNKYVVGRTSEDLTEVNWPDITVSNQSEIVVNNASVTVYRGIDGESLSQSGGNSGVWYIRPSWQARSVQLTVDYGNLLVGLPYSLEGGGIWLWSPGDAASTTAGSHEVPTTINLTLKAQGVTVATNSFTVTPVWVPRIAVTRTASLTPAIYPPPRSGSADEGTCYYFDDSNPGTSDTVTIAINYTDNSESAEGDTSQVWATDFGSGTFSDGGGIDLPFAGTWQLQHTGLVEGDAGEYTVTMTNDEGGIAIDTYELCFTPPSGEIVPGFNFDQASYSATSGDTVAMTGGWSDDLGNVTIEIVEGGGILTTSALTETTGTFTLTFANARESNTGNKTVKITDANGNEVESSAYLTVMDLAPPDDDYIERWSLTASTLTSAAYAAWLADNNKFTTTDALGFDGGRRSIKNSNAQGVSVGTNKLLKCPRNDVAPTFNGSRFEHYTRPTGSSKYDNHCQHRAWWSSSQLESGYVKNNIDWRWTAKLQVPSVCEWENHDGFVLVFQAYIKSPWSPAVALTMTNRDPRTNGIYHWRLNVAGSTTVSGADDSTSDSGYRSATFLGPPVVFGQIVNARVEFRLDYTGATGYARYWLNENKIGETVSGFPVGYNECGLGTGKNYAICSQGFYSWDHGENYISASNYPRVYFYESKYFSK